MGEQAAEGGEEEAKTEMEWERKNQKEDRIRRITLSLYPMNLINKQVKLKRESAVLTIY